MHNTNIKLLAAVATLLSALSGGAMAQVYAGVEVGSTKINDIGTASGQGLHLGYSIDPQTAVEFGYRNLGTHKVQGVDVKTSALQLSGTYGVLLGAADMYQAYGRLGLNRLTAKASVGSASASDNQTNLLWGIGLQAKFLPNMAARIEYQKPASDTRLISVGVNYWF